MNTRNFSFSENGKWATTANPKGLSLLEILIVLVIFSLAAGLIISMVFNVSSPRKDLDKTIEKIEKSVRFAVDEAVLRNTIVRLRFLLDESPQEFVLEFGPDEHFVLPKSFSEFENADELSEGEREEQKKFIENINKKFNRVKEFQDGNEVLPENVRIIGVGTTSLGKLIFGPEVSIFVYPSGEKDGAIIILGTPDEMTTFSIEEFNLDFKIDFFENEEKGLDLDDDEVLDYQFEKAKEYFEQWQK